MRKRIYISLTLVIVILVITVYTMSIRNLTNSNKLQVIGFENALNKSIIGTAQTYNFDENAMGFTLKSNGFRSGDVIPLKYVCDKINGGENVSIPLEWKNPTPGTKSFAIFMYDLNPVAKKFVHWAIINIPSNVSQIIERASGTQYMPSISVELKNSAGIIGYTGPCPPAGTGDHEYKIIVYALNTKGLNLSGFVSLSKFEAAIKGKVLSQSEISGYFKQ